MIPTVLLLGFVIGRWWAIPLGVLAWTLLLLLASVSIPAPDVPLAAALGAANTAVGVGVRLGLGFVLRSLLRITRLLRAA